MIEKNEVREGYELYATSTSKDGLSGYYAMFTDSDDFYVVENSDEFGKLYEIYVRSDLIW